MNINFIPERTLQHESEFEEMIDFILLEGMISSVLEIGTYGGGTAYAFAQIAEKVVCVDKQFGSDKFPIPIYRNTPEERKIIEIQGNSCDPETLWKLMELDRNGKMMKLFPVDLLFIDGGHHYHEVCADFWVYSNLVREGGWIAFHDAFNPAVAVRGFWEEIKKRFEHWEFLLEKQMPEKKKTIWIDSVQGIGLLRWRKDV